ncbi:MAG: methionyl-tRNA formyltransferase [Steroidobacteraceae bacterium]
MAENTVLRVAFAGTPHFAVPVLEALRHSRHQLVGVLTQPDRPKGRGRQLNASPVKLAAAPYVPVCQPEALKQPSDWAALHEWRADLLVVVAYGLILPQAVLDLPPLGCLNVHASLLPRWRGAAPVERALLAGDTETGLTVMRMEAGLDTGPILLQERVAIGPQDTGASLLERLAERSGPLLLAAVDGWAAGTLSARPQPAEGVTYARKLLKQEAQIDWRLSATQIERQVRALRPRALAETQSIDPHSGAVERLLVHAARLGPPVAVPAAPGTVLDVAGHPEPGYLRVQCGEGTLEVLVLQRPGGAPQNAGIFAHGPRRLRSGQRLGPPQ